MSNLGLLKRHPVATYYVLVFSISWGSLLAIVAAGEAPASLTYFGIALVGLFAGPSVAGILSNGIVHGRAGLHDLRSRLFKRRVNGLWYAVAALTIPVLVTVILYPLSLTSLVFLPALATSTDKASLVMIGISIGVVGGSLEELGWTGFAVPTLRSRYGVVTTGIIVGFLWGAWHVPITLWGGISLAVLEGPILFYAVVLPAYRVLMVWVYDRTGSLLVTMIMHWTLSASTLFILSPSASGLQLSEYYFILGAALWTPVVIISRRPHFSPLLRSGKQPSHQGGTS